jgi:catechol 2,3-dioxygenase-like lactoylglutathione lyase family enzyme
MSATSEPTIDIDGTTPDDVITPRELHHVTFKTNRLDEMIEFYGILTGHQPGYRGDSFAAITFDEANHRIALLGLVPWTELPPEQVAGAAGLHHVAYEYDSLDELLHTYLRVKRAGIDAEWTVNHGPTMSFYYRDPDGNGIELQSDNCGHDPERWTEIVEGPFQRNQMGINVSPEKMVDARTRGVSQEDIARDSYETRDNRYAAPGFGPPGLNLQPPPGVELPDVSS